MAKRKNKASKPSSPEVFMNLKSDFGFKKVFGNKVILTGFLNELKVLPEPITEIEYLPGEHAGLLPVSRKAVYDIHCRTELGKRFIIEMQIADQSHFEERMLFYSSYPIIEQAPRGKVKKKNRKGEEVEAAWDYSIDGVYTVAILDFILFREEEAKDTVIERVRLMRQEAGIVFTDKYGFTIIELPKFIRNLEKASTSLDKWLYSLRHIEHLSDCPEWIEEEEIRILYEEARIDKLTKKEMETYKRSVLEYDDVALAVDYAEEKGIEIGEKRGIEIGKRRIMEEIVCNSYKRGMSFKQIAEITGLTEKQISAVLSKK
jgi:predicted transposase/invertase (TIGR01784 family)